MSEMIRSEVVPIFGLSDGGAHTKFFTGGRSATETLVKFARDNPVVSLEEAHWRLPPGTQAFHRLYPIGRFTAKVIRSPG